MPAMSIAPWRRFQFNPDKFDIETTRTILLKALTGLPKNDLTLVRRRWS